ncbi:MAG: lipopolysaccharide biosynthesis protein [Gemmatimonadetes bacterium]|nr:lipopolysaccharide biosynthesis protein [Gemmatimonadota bacterium]
MIGSPEMRRGLIALLFGTGLTSVLALVYVVYVGRVLGPAEFAAFATSISVLNLLTIAAGPLNNTVTRFTAHHAGARELGQVVALLRLVRSATLRVGGAVVLVALALVAPASRFLQVDYAPLLATYAVAFFALLLNGSRGGLRGFVDFGAYNASLVLEAGLRLVVGVLLLSMVATATAGITAYALAAVVALIAANARLGRLVGRTPETPIDGQRVLGFGVGSLLFVFGIAGLQNVDMLLVKHDLSDHEAGLYGAAATIGRAIALLVIPFRLVALPLMTRRGERAGRGTVGLCLLYLMMSAPLLIALWIWPERILELLYGTAFRDASAVLPIVATAFLCGALAVLLAQPLMASARFGFVAVPLVGLAVETVLIVGRGATIESVGLIVLGTQAAVAIGTGVWVWLSRAVREST